MHRCHQLCDFWKLYSWCFHLTNWLSEINGWKCHHVSSLIVNRATPHPSPLFSENTGRSYSTCWKLKLCFLRPDRGCKPVMWENRKWWSTQYLEASRRQFCKVANTDKIWNKNIWDSVLALLTNCVCLNKLSKHLMPMLL